jgi:hypothetical protein
VSNKPLAVLYLAIAVGMAYLAVQAWRTGYSLAYVIQTGIDHASAGEGGVDGAG